MFQPGTVIADKYRVERCLGSGNMGLVFEATHLILRQRVALKVLHPERRTVPGAAERFLREARAASRLRTQYVARVFDMGETDAGLVYMAMEFLEGEDLLKRLERVGPFGVSEAVSYVLQACEGLAEAHGVDLVHRDIKPSNLFRAIAPDGTASIKLLDFGLSKIRGPQDSFITKDTTLLGSPVYMAPEQLMNASDVDARADIWALGVVLYELLTGVLPFLATTLSGLSTAIAERTPDPPSRLRPDLPPGLDDVVLRCLRKAPQERWPNVAALVTALTPWAPAALRGSAERCRHLLSRSAHTEVDPRPARVVESWPAIAFTAGDASHIPWQKHASRKVVLAVAGAGLVFCGATVGWIHGVGSTSTGQVDAAVTAPLPSGKPRSSAGGASGEGHFLPAPPSLPGTVPSSGHDPLAPPTTVQALDGARPAPAPKNTLRGKRALPSQNTSGPASDATPEAQAEDRHRRELDPSPYGHLALPAGAPERR